MHVGLVGAGPAAEAVRAACEDARAEVTVTDPGAVSEAALAVAAGPAGDDGFHAVHRAAGETPWLAVELGGVGGRPVPDVDAAVSGFAPGRGCFDCLRARVAANAEADSDGAVAGETADAATARFAGAVAGREAAHLLAGEPSAVLGGIVEVPHARRRFLPVPGCSCGDSPDPSLDRDHRPRDLDAVLEHAEVALDPRVGLVRTVGEAESFPVPYYLATLCDTSGFSDAKASEQAAGVAAGWDAAFMKALGESLERYSAGVYRASDFETAAVDELSTAVSPDEFVLPDDAPEAAGEIRWASGEDLETGANVHLPAEFVVFPPATRRFRPAITTGLGLGNGGVEALLSGLYEVVERDAAMLAWYSTFDPLGLDVDHAEFRALADRARAEDLSATALLVTQDVDVPVVAACVHRDGEWPRFAAGMSADLDAADAANAALEEALQNWTELRGMGRAGAAEEHGAIGRFADFPETAREFVDPATTVPAATVGPDDPPDGEAELVALIERVRDAGLDAYAARLTPRDVAGLDFEAVRVLVPAAQPLFTDDPYFGARARAVPADLGFEPRLDREHHPFP